MVLLLLFAGLVQHPQPTELADEITVFATDEYVPVSNITMGANQGIAANIAYTRKMSQDRIGIRIALHSTIERSIRWKQYWPKARFHRRLSPRLFTCYGGTRNGRAALVSS